MRIPRLGVLGLVGLVAAVVVAVALAQTPAGASRVQTITVVAQDVGSSFKIVDNRPLQGDANEEPPTAGDFFVGSQRLFTRAGRRAGTLDFQCVVITGGQNPRAQCTGGYGLRGGMIFVQAAFHGEQPIRIAVTGGTGAYEGVSGTAASRESNTGTVDTIRLIRD